MFINYSRDNPITTQQGSLIGMAGPKRGISMDCSVLFEFDMRIKKGEREEDDLQLIDGTVGYSELTTPCKPFTNRINGDGGAVDIMLSLVYEAVEATIEVGAISDARSDLSLSLSSFVCIGGSREEIGSIWKLCNVIHL
ncbi:hypothetical protein BAE44_0016745 [Dichanthelium oligosanthes]|uniref:DUF6598 domain-containing protein n=1 Tax=Dichanthelium oligosanthes TaxID=888268 RepID=A0A1E5VAZ1_9POAL|nr:hypothetical protein BAE44_0016745 [Dichanthelium oligosanthes]